MISTAKELWSLSNWAIQSGSSVALYVDCSCASESKIEVRIADSRGKELFSGSSPLDEDMLNSELEAALSLVGEGVKSEESKGFKEIIDWLLEVDDSAFKLFRIDGERATRQFTLVEGTPSGPVRRDFDDPDEAASRLP